MNTFTMGDIVDATVSLAISPSYFQTNSSALELEELSIEMFCFYEEEEAGVMVEMDHRKKVWRWLSGMRRETGTEPRLKRCSQTTT